MTQFSGSLVTGNPDSDTGNFQSVDYSMDSLTLDVSGRNRVKPQPGPARPHAAPTRARAAQAPGLSAPRGGGGPSFALQGARRGAPDMPLPAAAPQFDLSPPGLKPGAQKTCKVAASFADGGDMTRARVARGMCASLSRA